MVFVLFALLLLTIMGVGLLTMTEGEMLMGSNSLLRQRTQLEAENGLHVAAARKVVENDGRAVEVLLAGSGRRPSQPGR